MYMYYWSVEYDQKFLICNEEDWDHMEKQEVISEF